MRTSAEHNGRVVEPEPVQDGTTPAKRQASKDDSIAERASLSGWWMAESVSSCGSVWSAGYAAGLAVVPQLKYWRAALRIALGLFVFTILTAYVHAPGPDPAARAWYWITSSYVVRVGNLVRPRL